MIKKTLYFGNPAYLSKRNNQLVIKIPDANGLDEIIGNTIPIEDIGVIILDNSQLTITHGLIEGLLENNVALITCNSARMPVGMMLTLSGNSSQNERFRNQINASQPLVKQLWQQTIKVKIHNQAQVIKQNSVNIDNMLYWANEVKSGDVENHESRSAAYYWKNVFKQIADFKRNPMGEPPNNLLNYGYAILRAVIARSLVISGLLPTIGIHHHNRYNAYCLADDIMEPYRPYVDKLVVEIVSNGEDYTELSKSVKQQLLSIPQLDVMIKGKKSPLMIAATQTTASLCKCFEGVVKKIDYPMM